MNKILGVLGMIFYLTMHQANAQKEVDKVSVTLHNDFETGELFGWETYPYAQDIGFDALYFTRKSPTFNKSNFALARSVKANDGVELTHGFTKRINLWATPQLRLKAAIYFQSDRNPEMLEISLGTFDGELYIHTISNPKANQWLEIDIPIEHFQLNGKPLKPGDHIQVVTLEAKYPSVYYLYTYTMLMDDFRINGDRQRHFVAVDPASTDLEMFDISILNKHYFYGDQIAFTVIPEGDIPLRQVIGTLLDSNNRIIKDNIGFSRSKKGWTNPSIHRLNKIDARGQWEIMLTGQTEKGTEVRWGFRFLMPGTRIKEHPRLLFSANELQQRMSNEKSPVVQKILDNALKDTEFMDIDIDAIEEEEDRTVDNLVGGPYSKNAVGFNAYGSWSSPMRRLGNIIREGSFRYAFTGDKKAGEKAKKALLKLCTFGKWNAAWMLERKFWTYYPVGYTLIPVAYGYDMLHDLLSENEQRIVRETILEKGLKHFHRDMVEMNRMPSSITNHIAVLAAGHGLAATVIYGEDPENRFMEPYLSGIITKTKTFIDRTYYEDGSYGEPKTGYMNMATKEIALILHTFERNFGIDWTTTTDVSSFYKYPLQAMHSSGLIADFGDGHNNFKGFTEHHSEYFVYRTGNPFLYQYIKPYWEEGKGGYLGYLWYRDDILPVPRESLPTSKVFEAQGMVMRSGWEDSSTIISTRFGPHSNHYHYDQGSFQLMTNGEELLIDPGIGAGGYYANFDYDAYNIQAIAHNVMLIDHDAESQNPAHFDNDIAALREWPRMVHTFAGEVADVVEGDLSSVYKDKLKTYTRTFLYTKSGPLFLFDQVESNSESGHIYDWLFHAPERSINYSNQQVLIDQPNARLTIEVVVPEIRSATIRDRSNDKESFITLSSGPDQTSIEFLAIIFPEAKTSEFDDKMHPVTTRIDTSGWIGAKVEHKGNSDLGLFRINDAADKVEGFSSDGKRIMASFDASGNLLKLYFEGTYIEGHGISVRNDGMIACAIAMDPSSLKLEVKSDHATNLMIKTEQKVSKILLNGSINHNWNKNVRKNELMIKVPAGMNKFSLQ